MNTDTPETGVAWRYPASFDSNEKVVHISVAQRLERERDEAREQAEHWKMEYEIVVARLRGRKHPRDNGIVAPDEIIPMLTRERDAALAELEMWRDGNIMHEIHRDELEEAKRNAGIRVTDKIPNENYHPQYGGTSLL